jgi:hypothetical protein
MSDAYPDRRLAPLVFIDLDQARNPLHVFLPIAGCQDFGDALVFFHLHLHDPVQYLVRRQRILIGLVGPQFGRRRARQNALRDHV